MIKVGLQIPNFTYPDTAPGELFEKVAAVAVAAEDAGADTVMVMDHFYQLAMLGPSSTRCSRPTPSWARWPHAPRR